MSKVLVFKDWGEFLKRLNMVTIESVCVVADVKRLLKDYEVEVTEFEVIGSDSFIKAQDGVRNAFMNLGVGEKFKVFVIGKGK